MLNSEKVKLGGILVSSSIMNQMAYCNVGGSLSFSGFSAFVAKCSFSSFFLYCRSWFQRHKYAPDSLPERFDHEWKLRQANQTWTLYNWKIYRENFDRTWTTVALICCFRTGCLYSIISQILASHVSTNSHRGLATVQGLRQPSGDADCLLFIHCIVPLFLLIEKVKKMKI